jgi:hypothetical protein
MPRFPKPTFENLLANYSTDRESIHACPLLYRKENLPPSINTCALRISEALVIANGLVESREAISALTRNYSNGRAFLMGPYGYRANLCPHGIGRGARDVSDFLRQQWGSPSLTWTAQEDGTVAPPDIDGLTGVIAFAKLPGYAGQGHVDLWNQTGAVGHAYWNAQNIYFWRLD